MDSTPRAMDRWLPFVGAALLVEAAVGFLPNVRIPGPNDIPHLVNAGCAAAVGGATLLAARRRRSPEILRAFLWMPFLAIGAMKLGVYLGYGVSIFMSNSSFMFGTASWSMIGFGAPVLWGSALARRDDPGNLLAQKAGRIAAGLVQVGYVFLFASEVRTWGMYASMGGSFGGGAAAAYGMSQALQTVDRVLLLWATVDSVRTAMDDDLIRRRAQRIHKLMSWWILLSLLSSGLSQVVTQMTTGSSTSIHQPSFILQFLISTTITLAAMMAVLLHFQSKRAGYNSDAPPNPLTGAEA